MFFETLNLVMGDRSTFFKKHCSCHQKNDVSFTLMFERAHHKRRCPCTTGSVVWWGLGCSGPGDYNMPLRILKPWRVMNDFMDRKK